MKVQYRIVPVTRYVVTRYKEDDDDNCGVSERGEYGNREIAYEVAHALCKAEHDAAEKPIDSANFIYPDPESRYGAEVPVAMAAGER